MDAKITQAQVWAAANALEREGEEIGIATVRHRMDDAGDFETINEAMEMWHRGFGRG